MTLYQYEYNPVVLLFGPIPTPLKLNPIIPSPRSEAYMPIARLIPRIYGSERLS